MFTLNCKGRLLVVDKPVVMGIINCTPDSFFAGSRRTATNSILYQAEKMIKEGAAIIDIGGQSSRPGSAMIGPDEELKRIIPAIAEINRQFPEVYISVDSFYALVAREAVAAGACIVNDISAGQIDSEMITTVAELSVPYVLMHMKGTPLTMQQNPEYDDVAREVLDFFIDKSAEFKRKGINDIIIDPGFGFGKTIEHNFEILRKLEIFQMLNTPLLLGVSRKSIIYKTLDTTPENALNGTTVLNTAGLLKGASILRVHDVKEAAEAIKLVSGLL
ncbi:MAG: dihydropteroate synthase [Chitinophagaceae bacterium]|nr:dihydropteroate synthase [Chitinophagaceae bacterium]